MKQPTWPQEEPGSGNPHTARQGGSMQLFKGPGFARMSEEQSFDCFGIYNKSFHCTFFKSTDHYVISTGFFSIKSYLYL